MPENNWLRFTVAIDSIRPSRAGYGKPLLVSAESEIPEVYQDVSELSEIEDWGVSTNDPLYAAASSLITQDGSRPPVIGVGARTAAVAQVDTVTVTGSANGSYIHTIVDHDGNSTPFTFVASSNTNTQIRDGLIALVDASSRYAAVSTGSGTYTVTASVAGASFTSTYSVSGGPSEGALAGTTTTDNNGAADDLAAIRSVNTSWYGITLTDHVDHSIYEGSRWAEAQGVSDPVMLFGQSNTAGIITSGTTDVAAVLNSLGRRRTAVIYHALDTQYVDAAIQGRCLTADPGTINWAWRTLNGITSNTLTSAQVSYLKYYNQGGSNGKAANYVEQFGGRPTFFDGRTASSIYIELIRGADKLRTEVLASLVNLYQTNDSIPFDEEGIELTANAMQAPAVRLSGRRGEPGLVDRDSIRVTRPDLANVNETERANSFLSGVRLSATIKGNINEVSGSGTLSVSITT